MNQTIDLDLIIKIRSGDLLSKDELVRKYLPMVRYIVKNQNTPTTDFDDYCQEGTIGLLKAISEYNYELFDIKFSTFAYICILRRISNIKKSSFYRKNQPAVKVLSLNSGFNPDDSRDLIESIPNTLETEPFIAVVEAWSAEHLDHVLETYLSPVEYLVITKILSGLSQTEIQKALNLSAKVVDNARTRVKNKIKRLLFEYGSLLSPDLPMKTRKRKDLQLQVG